MPARLYFLHFFVEARWILPWDFPSQSWFLNFCLEKSDGQNFINETCQYSNSGCKKQILNEVKANFNNVHFTRKKFLCGTVFGADPKQTRKVAF